MGRILVVGGTGTVGSDVAAGLAKAGADVAVATRNAAGKVPAGATAVRLDLTDESTWAGALAGVKRIFVLSPGGQVSADTFVGPFLRKAFPQLERIVLMTASGVEFDDGIPLRKLEKIVEASGVPYTILRPTWFSQNFNTYWIGAIRATGNVLVPAEESKTAFIDARDIADAAIAALTKDGFASKAYTLTGPAALTYGEATRILSRETGAKIGYQSVTEEAFRTALLQAGVSADYTGLMLALFGTVRQGFASRVTDDVKTLTGHAPRDLAEYARSYRSAFV